MVGERLAEYGPLAELGPMAGAAIAIVELVRTFLKTIEPKDLNEGEDRAVAELHSYVDPPKTLQELQPWPPSQSAGRGYEWHHIVEQNPSNRKKFGDAMIDDPSNLVRVPRLKHEEISGEYSRPSDDGTNGPSLREKLSQEDFGTQREAGLAALRKHGVLK
jgi:hypothetical protein